MIQNVCALYHKHTHSSTAEKHKHALPFLLQQYCPVHVLSLACLLVSAFRYAFWHGRGAVHNHRNGYVSRRVRVILA